MKKSVQWGKTKCNFSFSKEKRMPDQSEKKSRGLSEGHRAIYNHVNNYKKKSGEESVEVSQVDQSSPLGKSFQMRGRGELPNQVYRVNYPGPGRYDQPSFEQNKNLKQGMFLKRDRFDDGVRKAEFPGPGTYDSQLASSTAEFQFPRLPSQHPAHHVPPGPAEYSLKSTIANIPNYLSKSASATGDHLKAK